MKFLKRPGGKLATRPLHFIWIADCSGSMGHDGKIQALNTAIREAIPHMKKISSENPNADIIVRAVLFSDEAAWHISPGVRVEDFAWVDLSAGGVTNMGEALSLVADELSIPPMTDRALPPVLVLISDGRPTDDYAAGLMKLLKQPWGKKAVRLAVSIGEDADDIVLQQFIGRKDIYPLQANNPEALITHIRWISTAVLKSASSPASSTLQPEKEQYNVHIPEPITLTGPVSDKDVW